jgi:hypothetical protein
MSFVVIAWTAVAVTAAGTAASVHNSNMQQKSAKTAADIARTDQERLLKKAEEKAAGESATASSAISRARQKALAAATAATGRASTIKTGSQGLIGSAPGETKSLIGE